MIQATFRDPAGQLVIRGDEIVRGVTQAGARDLEKFLNSASAKAMMAEGRLIATKEIDAAAAGDLKDHFTVDVARYLRHPAIEFPSYPYEWPVEMLHAAAVSTLQLFDRLLSDGIGLKDATPFNILFQGPRPVFVDVLSFEERCPEDPLWRPEAQFSQTFLLPLLAYRLFGTEPARVFVNSPGGLEPGDVYAMCSPLRRLCPPVLGIVSLPVWLDRPIQSEAFYRECKTGNAEKAEFVLRHLLKRLRRRLASVVPVSRGRSAWSEYMQNLHYRPEEFALKQQFVSRALAPSAVRRVLDVGCNTGHFSLMAARAEARVVAVDADPGVVGQLWIEADRQGLDILPLVQNLAVPSPRTGWQNNERFSFRDRAEGSFDLVLFLAVVHHLMVTERIPLREIASFAAALTRATAVVEYVGPEDDQFKSLLRGRGGLYDKYSREAFESAFGEFFRIAARQPIPGRDRILYLLEKTKILFNT